MPRIRIGKDTELSATPRSIVITDATNEQQYVPPGANNTILTVVAGVPTWQSPVIPSEYNQYANLAAFPVTGATDVIYLDQATSKFYVWNGTIYVETPAASTFTFNVTGDTGTSQPITTGNTVTIKGATNSGVRVNALATDTLDISLREVKDSFTPAAAATTVTLTQTPGTTVDLYRNGILQKITTDYTIAGTTVTLVVAIGASGGGTTSETIDALYRY
jgi:hypothetical protein